MTEDLGYAISCIDDIDPMGRVVFGNRAVAEAVARRLITPTGSLMHHGEYGYDVRSLLNENADDRTVFQIVSGIESQALRDERVLSVNIEAQVDVSLSTAIINVSGESTFGPFELVLNISDVTSVIVDFL